MTDTDPATDPATDKVSVVWRITDGKPGHENQTTGLLQALQQYTPLQIVDLPPAGFFRALGAVLFKMSPGFDHPAPDLVIGAGHATHWTILAVSRVYAIPSIVLMKPGLPMAWFDLCIVPEHDQVPASSRCLVTRGALNKIVPTDAHQYDQGLFLIGGPSRHYQWNDKKVIEQIQAIVGREPEVDWQLTTSRRTPDSFIPMLKARIGEQIEVVPVEETDPDWVTNALANSGRVWISEDSVSMVYEALSSGAACGLLELSSRHAGKIQRGIKSLEANGLIAGFTRWSASGELHPPATVFNEAKRCAQQVYEKWMKKS